jgi:hypothetical protein
MKKLIILLGIILSGCNVTKINTLTTIEKGVVIKTNDYCTIVKTKDNQLHIKPFSVALPGDTVKIKIYDYVFKNNY